MNFFSEKKIRSFAYAIGNMVHFFSILPFRIKERLARRQHYKKIKKLFDSPENVQYVFQSDNIITNLEQAAMPGCTELLPWSQDAIWKNSTDKTVVNDLFQHKLKILSDVGFDLSIKDDERVKEIQLLANELPDAARLSYQPIDWHKDFRSGYRWDQELFFLDVKVAPVVGVEIKLPRELSRFQHIGILAAAPMEQGANEFILEVIDWIVANPAGYGVNWGCTMDVALRALNWIWGIRYFEPMLCRYPAAAALIIRSLHKHGQHIAANLEYYKVNTGNHYLSNITGLIYIGAAFPDFPESDNWLLFGMQELLSEMDREVYTDGYAHEGSTHYHRLVAELFLSSSIMCERIPAERRKRLLKTDVGSIEFYPRLRNSIRSRIDLGTSKQLLPNSFYERLYKMVVFTDTLKKPNHLVPQFGDNDSARAHKLIPAHSEEFSDHRHLMATMNELLGNAHSEEDEAILYEAKLLAGGVRLDAFAKTQKKPPLRNNNAIHFKQAGIVVINRESIFLAVTCGTNGQNQRGGHNHNDKLSFELNIEGYDIIVDGGCPVYTAQPEIRNQFRSTAAHNTLMLGSEEQDKLPGGVGGLFSLPERSFPSLKLVNDHTIEGRHLGYTVPHKRSFIIEKKKLSISDRMDSDMLKKSYLNFHPSVACEIGKLHNNELHCRLHHNSGLVINMVITGATGAVILPGFFSKGYGRRVDNSRLEVSILQNETGIEFTW